MIMLKKKHSSLIISYVILIVLAYVMIYPLLWMVGASFKSNAEIFSTVGLLPKEPVFGAFKAGWEGTGRYGFSTYLINSFELVLPTVLFTVISGVLIGYGFARFDFPLKKFWFAIMLSTLMLPSTVIIIPRYIYFKQLGWLDSYMPFWIPALLGCTTFFRGLPLELDESAKLDGCNSFRILIQILLPLCKSAIFSAIVFQFVWIWNDFLNTLIYVSSVVKYPVSLGLRMSMDIATEFDWNQIMAMSLISILPPVIIFFAAQKYFVDGIATTGMKN